MRMMISSWLKASVEVLEAANNTGRLDAEVLLSDALEKNRAWVLAHPDYELDKETVKKLEVQLKRREKHEPLAYIRGKVEFYGREFFVDESVLVPRPESETMIELFKKLDLPKNPIIADIGSGSGAIGITASLEVKGMTLHLIDIDPKTLVTAEHNARDCDVRAHFHKGNLLDAYKEKYDVLLCNLPYVPESYTINAAAMTEPKIAIFGGADGLDLYRALFAQLQTGNFGEPVVLTESLPFQHSDLRNIASEAGYSEIIEDDFIQQFHRL